MRGAVAADYGPDEPLTMEPPPPVPAAAEPSAPATDTDLEAAAEVLTNPPDVTALGMLLGRIVLARLDPLPERQVLARIKSRTGIAMSVLDKQMAELRRRLNTTGDLSHRAIRPAWSHRLRLDLAGQPERNEANVITALMPGAVAEIRRATGTIAPFLDRDTGGLGQHDWVAELADRVVPPPGDAPVVCALDTGVAAEHPLIAPGLRGAWAYDAAWGEHDDAPHGGHGTAIVGLVLYGNLEPHMNGMQPVELTHGAESMKLLPPHGFPATRPPSYGVVTQGAVALVEAEQPDRLRSFCLATSATDFPPSRPSSWSGALDQIAAGAMPGDALNDAPATDGPNRLVLVATGNVSGGMMVDIAQSQPLEDPSQSWNALTVGGYTTKEQVPAPPPVLEPVVPANDRSPFSRGSLSLPDDLTPIKPEVLFEAGNMLSDGTGFCAWHETVSLLAPGSDVAVEPLVPFWATSAAVGVAGNFMGRLQAALPELWPETRRALTVDSAAWPQPMRRRLIGRGAHWKTGSKGEKQQVLREVGYGVPDIGRAILSARNDVTMIAEAELQPFAIGADGRTGVFNEMHFYDLPWPSAALERLENKVVTMKVTLSYFVEPNLTGRAATRPLRRDTAVMMAAALVLVPVFAMGQLGRFSGVILVAGLAAYLIWAYRQPGDMEAEDVGVPAPASALVSTLWIIGGLVALMVGARFLVDGAVNIARGYGISEAFIGLTIVAVGTSLPELATSLIAAFRRQSEIAIGNIVGSNIFNVLGILGVTALIAPIPVASRFLTFDLPVMIAVSLVLTALLLTRPVIGRGIGVAMLAGYVAYVWAAQG